MGKNSTGCREPSEKIKNTQGTAAALTIQKTKDLWPLHAEDVLPAALKDYTITKMARTNFHTYNNKVIETLILKFRGRT